MKNAAKIKNAGRVPVPRVRKFKKIRKKKIRTAADVGSSKLEKVFEIFLKRLGIEVETQHKVAWKFYDYKVKGKNILIEMDGDYWHCNPKLFPDGPINYTQRMAKTNDFYKDCLAKNNGYELIRIWEHDFKKHPKKVISKLKSYGL